MYKQLPGGPGGRVSNHRSIVQVYASANPKAMIDNPYLDTIISLVLVYALLSILVSVLLEAWNKRIKMRGVFLQKVIFRLLDDPLNKNYGYLIYQHPILNKMRKDGNSYPHYVAAEGFTNALIDTLADQAVSIRYVEGPDGSYVKERNGQDEPLTKRLEKGVHTMADSEFKRLLTNFMDRSKVDDGSKPGTLRLDLDKLKVEMGRWFDDYMDRASGEYKNDQRSKLRFIGLLVAVVLNVDSLHLTKVFLMDKDLRDRMVERAEGVSDALERSTDTTEVGLRRAVLRTLTQLDTTEYVQLRNDSLLVKSLAVLFDDSAVVRERQQSDSVLAVLDQWQLPIGWSRDEAPVSWVVGTANDSIAAPPIRKSLTSYFEQRNRGSVMHGFLWFFGILITGWSLSLGAPFWFETLVKLINIRRSGAKPKTTDDRNA
jgi:hypothetical protein